MSLRVLIVDDSPTMRKMVTRALQMSGLPIASVTEAADGLAGMESIAAAPVDLALVDVNMPRMNGIEMLEQVRRSEHHKDLPVVVVSTEGSAPRIERIRELAAGFVRKPFTPENLIDAVIDAIGGKANAPSERYRGTNSDGDF